MKKQNKPEFQAAQLRPTERERPIFDDYGGQLWQPFRTEHEMGMPRGFSCGLGRFESEGGGGVGAGRSEWFGGKIW